MVYSKYVETKKNDQSRKYSYRYAVIHHLSLWTYTYFLSAKKKKNHLYFFPNFTVPYP